MRHALSRFALLAALLASTIAGAQTLQQSGPWKGGHVPAYFPGGGSSVPLVIDSGAAGGGASTQGISEMLLIAPASPTGPLGTNWCDYDANPTTTFTGYHYLCFSPNANGSGEIVFGAAGGAAQIPLNFNINGVSFPAGGGSGAAIAFPASVTGGVSGAIPYFSNSGTLSPSALLVGGNLVVGGGAGGAPATTATGVGILNALGINVGTAGAPVVNGGALGTPSSGDLSNTINLPRASITGLGTGVSAALAVNIGLNGSVTAQNGALVVGRCLTWGPGITDSGAGCSGGLTVGATTITGGSTGNIEYNNAGVLGELATTGSGNVVRATSPTLVTPALGTPASGNLTNAIGLPITTGVSGLGTGVATALGTATNTSGGHPVLNGSPTVGNCLNWSSSGIQGTTLPCSGLVVGTTTMSGGAANQIPYDTGTVLQESSGLKFISPSLQIAGTYIAAGTHPTATGSGGTCAGAATGGASVGIITLTGACAAGNTIALSSLPTVPTGYVCTANNRTTPANLVNETSSTVTGATFTIAGTTSGSTDVIQFKCQAY
jgi:hypothetical protein